MVIHYLDKEGVNGLTEEDKTALRKIEIAATKCINNWKMPFQLRTRLFANQNEIRDYRTSLQDRQRYMTDEGEPVDDDVLEPPDMLITNFICEPLMPGQTESQVFAKAPICPDYDEFKPATDLLDRPRLGTIREESVLEGRPTGISGFEEREEMYESFRASELDEKAQERGDAGERAALYNTLQNPLQHGRLSRLAPDAGQQLTVGDQMESPRFDHVQGLGSARGK